MNYQLAAFCLSIFTLCNLYLATLLYAEEIHPQRPTMSMYTKEPAVLGHSVKPSVMLMLDNSRSMYDLAYKPQENKYDHSREYYGLFNPQLYYRYDDGGDYFEQCAENSTESDCPWNGNFLNWLTMRRMDISKRVLTGGIREKDGDDTYLTAEPDPCPYSNIKYCPDLGSIKYSNINGINGVDRFLTPYDYSQGNEVSVKFTKKSNPAEVNFQMSGSKQQDNYRLKIKLPKGEKTEGIIQETASDIRYGLTYFLSGDPGVTTSDQGGTVEAPIGSNTEKIIEEINDKRPRGYTPLAETLYTITGYFKQTKDNPLKSIKIGDGWGGTGRVGPRYKGNDSYQIRKKNIESTFIWDPFYFSDKKELVSCSKAFVIMITDGFPTSDFNIPFAYRDKKAGQSQQASYLANVAYYAHHSDLRDDLAGNQNLTIYPIYLFGEADEALKTLIYTAKQGGFDDVDGNGTVDDDEVKIDPVRGLPTNCFTANDGIELTEALRATLSSIQNSASSGTSVAILNSSIDGSGATFQSMYFPSLEDDFNNSVKWAGEIHSLFIDSYGNLREDTKRNQQLDLVEDLIIKTVVEETGNITISKYRDANGNGRLEQKVTIEDPYNPGKEIETTLYTKEPPVINGKKVKIITPDPLSEFKEVEKGLSTEDIAYLWSGGNRLSHIPNSDIGEQRSKYLSSDNKRYMFTYIDKNRNQIVDSGEVLPFTADELTASGTHYWGYFLGTTPGGLDKRDLNSDGTLDNEDLKILVNYVRGKEYDKGFSLRSRKYFSRTKPGEDTVDKTAVWRLGDIVTSSPVAVQAPFAGYDISYNSKSYRKFKRKYSARRTMIYTGSNDGIFHAFNGGFYQKSYTITNKAGKKRIKVENKFWGKCVKDNNSGELTCHEDGVPLGQEMWAYVPQNLLPHLQWLPQKNYSHVFYNDLPPFICEAQLWDKENDPIHVGGWGTLLVGGMRFGGGPIEVTANVQKDDNTAEEQKITMRSAYFVIDITDPEKEPVLLDEFTVDSDERASFTTVQPTLEYVTTDAENEVRGWYLVFGTGPTNLEGESKQNARVFVRKLASLPLGAGQSERGTAKRYQKFSSELKEFEIAEQNSFIGEFYGSDFQVGTSTGAFTTDAIYFGTVAGVYKSSHADRNWQGKMHRIVVSSGSNDPSNVSTWMDTILYDAEAPISTKPQVSLDEKENAWVYFGTGRYLFAEYDKKDVTPRMNLFGIKEPMKKDAKLGKIPAYTDNGGATVRKKDLMDTSGIKVYAGKTAGSSKVKIPPGTETNFAELEKKAEKKQGWFFTLNAPGERVVVNPAVRSQIANFNTFTPSEELCESDNTGRMYNFYYKTGTAFWRPIMGTQLKNTTTVYPGSGPTERQGLSIVSKSLNGMGASSSFQSGAGGLNQIIQNGQGGIEEFPVEAPGPSKSGRVFWENRRH